MILKFKEEIPFSEDLLVGQRSFLRLFIEAPGQEPGNFARKACGSADDPLMVFTEDLFVYTRPVIIAVHISRRDDLHKVGIPCIVLRQQDQMIITVLARRIFPVKTGARSHVHFTAENRTDSLAHAFLIEINDAKHHAVIRDRGTVHPQLLHPADIVLDLVRAVQQTVFCMCVKMSESQSFSFSNVITVPGSQAAGRCSFYLFCWITRYYFTSRMIISIAMRTIGISIPTSSSTENARPSLPLIRSFPLRAS